MLLRTKVQYDTAEVTQKISKLGSDLEKGIRAWIRFKKLSYRGNLVGAVEVDWTNKSS